MQQLNLQFHVCKCTCYVINHEFTTSFDINFVVAQILNMKKVRSAVACPDFAARFALTFVRVRIVITAGSIKSPLTV